MPIAIIAGRVFADDCSESQAAFAVRVTHMSIKDRSTYVGGSVSDPQDFALMKNAGEEDH